MLRNALVFLACGALVGCNATTGTVSGSAQASAGPPPANYRTAVATYVRDSFFDPYSIRDAQISAPILKAGVDLLSPGPVWTVCVRLNAKNRMGAYTGRQDTLIRFAGDSPKDSVNDVGTMCKDAVYEPFPEIEQRA